MKIVVITGSGRANSSSGFLADMFIKGAEDAGAEVYRFNAAFEEIWPCKGCGTCKLVGKCSIKDSYAKLVPKILEADEIVWTTPVYYMTMTASIKIVIDRLYQLENKPSFIGKKKYVILSTAWAQDIRVFDILISTIDAFSRFLKWEKAGQVLAPGIDNRKQIVKTRFGDIAYKLGKEQVIIKNE